MQQGPQLGHTPKGRSHLSIRFKYVVLDDNEPEHLSVKYAYSAGRYTDMVDHLTQIPWHDLFDGKSVSVCYETLIRIYRECLSSFVPKSNGKRSNEQPWIDRQAKAALRAKHEMFYSNSFRRDDQSRKEFNKACATVKKEIKRSIDKYELELVERSKRAPKILFSYVNRKQKVKPHIRALKGQDGQTVTDTQGIVRVLNDQFKSVFVDECTSTIPEFGKRTDFVCKENKLIDNINRDRVLKLLKGLDASKAMGVDEIHPAVLKNAAEGFVAPLLYIFRLSFETGCLPWQWSVANVSPIYKGGSKLDPSNYRPVPLTSITCKMFETILRDAIVEHLVSNRLICDEQHGFVPKKSCVTNLLETLDVLTFEMAKGKPLAVVYLDFAKAFDKVPHQRLLLKLKSYGITGKLYDWIEAFLRNRKQRVVAGTENAEWVEVTSGVPQGSVLGPILFIIFINDLPGVVKNIFKMYADDSKIISNVQDVEHRVQLQKDLDCVVKWCNDWSMELNCKKCKIIHFGNQQVLNGNMSTYSMVKNGTTHQLQESECERDLGILVEPGMKWKAQVQASVNKASRILGLLKNTFESREIELWKQLYTTYIRPHLEFAVAAWNPPNVAEIAALERVQRRATRIPSQLKGLSYEARLGKLSLTTLDTRRKRGDLIQFYKLMNHLEEIKWHRKPVLNIAETTNETPALRPRSHNKRVRSQSFCSREINDYCSSVSSRMHYFSNRVSGPWNSLTHKAANAENLNQFKARVDELLC
jgi:hypothetical protein